jgi:hypothetical protein
MPLPSILVVDDEPDRSERELKNALRGKATLLVAHPNDVVESDLSRSDLVLVDYRLENWAARDISPVSLAPQSGLSLAAILRDRVDQPGQAGRVAFGLLSGHLQDVRGRLASTSPPQVVARLNNLEWVFEKGQQGLAGQVALLAGGLLQCRSACRPMAPDGAEKALERLLGLDKRRSWGLRAWEGVWGCQPPLQEMDAEAGPIALVRWLLHNIQPYPTFLWSDHYVAARLRIGVASLRAIVDGESRLALDLSRLAYKGAFASFLGRRWWRAGLEDYLWDATKGMARDVTTLRQVVKERAGTELGEIALLEPVVTLNKDLSIKDEFCGIDDAVRVRPEWWPAYADSAWMRRDDAVDVLPLVEPSDRPSLDDPIPHS